jgi:hypothetical protein
MSVMKRKWGESLSARQPVTQQLQVLLRGVVYNLHRLTMLGVSLCLFSGFKFAYNPRIHELFDRARTSQYEGISYSQLRAG